MSLRAQVMGLPPLKQLLRSAARKRSEQFRARDPHAEQRAIFRELLRAASATQFGKDYGFARLAELPFEKAYPAFSGRIPIRTYQDFWSDYFAEKQIPLPNGKRLLRLDNATWPGRIELFCETSGTTAPTKYIPFSRQMFAKNRRAALDLISCYLSAHPASTILSGKILYMSGSTDLTEMEAGIHSGDMSAITLRFSPWYLKPFVEPCAEVSSLPWDQKLQAMAELLLRDKAIRVISGVPPWIILLLKRCREMAEKPLARVLPQLELIIHGGTSIAPYRDEFAELFGDTPPNFIELLPASEAFMGFQCAGDTAMRLTPYYGTFFEFVRFEELDEQGRPEPYSRAIPLERVETGQRYALILNTCAGLWRYHIGDTIRFTDLSPHFIEFTGRDRFLDKLEEKVTQEEVERVVADLNQSGGCAIREFFVGTDVPLRKHVWVLASNSDNHCSRQLGEFIDIRLCLLNADYATFRNQGRIAAPEVVMVPENLIYEWSRSVRGKLGGQSKIPHIDPTPDASMLASLKEFIAD
jgi:hypothetical protein